MNRRTIITIIIALVAMAGQAQVKCHVVGTVADGVNLQTFYIAQAGTADNDDAKWTEVNVKDGHFALDIVAETTEMYEMITKPQRSTERLSASAHSIADGWLSSTCGALGAAHVVPMPRHSFPSTRNTAMPDSPS
jgi:hypothetical protein